MVTLADRVARVRALAPTLLLGAVAAAVSWLLAKHAFGTRGAFFAPVAAIIAFGLSAGARVTRAIEVSVGVPLGIAVADVLVLELGAGPVQLFFIILLAMAVAVALGGGPLFVTQAAVSAILVVTLQPPTSGLSFVRAADALIGCGVALVLTFVVAPIDPLRLVRREARPVLDELAGVLEDLARALEGHDRRATVAALERARRIDAHTQRFLEALAVGRETAVAAPQRRDAREPLAIYSEASGQIDLAVRNVRVLARAVLRAIDVEDEVPPTLPGALRALRDAVHGLAAWLEEGGAADVVVDPAVRAAHESSAVLEHTSNLSVSVIVGQIRSTTVDLLRTTGMAADEARRRVRGEEPEVLADM
jgi:uncharacterized membrane protein YgaE (UPF0421/DUF939 family)